jgi:hypothetical protein
MNRFLISLLIGCALTFTLFHQSIFAQDPPFKDNTRLYPSKFVPSERRMPATLQRPFTKMPGHYTVADWKTLIDTMWGEGPPTLTKLQIFDTFWDIIDKQWGCFPNLRLNWDSLRTLYRPQVEAGVSRGRFYAIMSQLGFALQEVHSHVRDAGIDSSFYYPGGAWWIYPGIPEVYWGGYGVTGAGMGVAPMPDSSLFVYQVQPGNPLGMQPGDIVLGYDGRRWVDLLREIDSVQFPITPMYSIWGSHPEGYRYTQLNVAPGNWYLYDTMDVVRYATGDTVHLSTTPLANVLPGWDTLYCTDQIPVPGVPMPSPQKGTMCTWGIIEGTTIGYIYAYDWSYTDSALFRQAVQNLRHTTTGLILDFRVNWGGDYRSSYGGLSQLFNADFSSNIETARRTDPNDHMGFTRTPFGPPLAPTPDIYDHPIAVLTGPACLSAGDYTAFYLRFHPMVRFFGKRTNTAYVVGIGATISLGAMWEYRFFTGSLYSNYNGEGYLIHKGFNVDEDVWLNREDAAHGVDAVVKRAVAWITNASYAHDVTITKNDFTAGADTVWLQARVTNPNAHSLSLKAYYNANASVIDSTIFYDDGLHGDSLAGDGIWGTMWIVPNREDFFNVAVSTADSADGSRFTLPNLCQFTTAGPMVVDSVRVTKRAGYNFNVRPYLRNMGLVDTITAVSVNITSNRPGITQIFQNQRTLPNLPPGAVTAPSPDIAVMADTGTFTGVLGFRFDIQCSKWTFWTDSVEVTTGSIHLNRPNGGEEMVGRTTDTIRWTSAGISNVRIEMSTDDGVTWPVVITGNTPAAPGAYLFKVPDLPTGQCKIRVRDVTFPLLNDISDTTFTLSPSPSVTAEVSSKQGWNLLSVPLRLNDFSVDSVYPARVLPVLGYTDHYIQCDTLECGRGYWVKLPAPQALSHTGRIVDSNVVDVKAGWNMIGSISIPVAVATIASNPGGLVTSNFFGYAGEYIYTDSLQPGKGYWVNVSQDGQLILKSSMPILNTSNRIRIIATDELPPAGPDNKTVANLIPKTFALAQSYPNPFNPTTTIQYDVPINGWVTLKVYDVLGREVAVLVNGLESPDYKQVTFNANSLPTGVYTYRLTAGSFVQTKKMLLIK